MLKVIFPPTFTGPAVSHGESWCLCRYRFL